MTIVEFVTPSFNVHFTSETSPSIDVNCTIMKRIFQSSSSFLESHQNIILLNIRRFLHKFRGIRLPKKKTFIRFAEVFCVVKITQRMFKIKRLHTNNCLFSVAFQTEQTVNINLRSARMLRWMVAYSVPKGNDRTASKVNFMKMFNFLVSRKFH